MFALPPVEIAMGTESQRINAANRVDVGFGAERVAGAGKDGGEGLRLFYSLSDRKFVESFIFFFLKKRRENNERYFFFFFFFVFFFLNQ